MKIARHSTAERHQAFTLVEIVMALGVIGVLSLGCYLGFNSLNSYAISSRLYTEAQSVAQNQIDLILSKGPFDPANNKVPAILQIGTTTTPNVFVYRDPVNGNVVVSGTMTTTISDPGWTMTYAGSTNNLNIRKATVTISYQFRNTNYSISMDTFRTADL